MRVRLRAKLLGYARNYPSCRRERTPVESRRQSSSLRQELPNRIGQTFRWLERVLDFKEDTGIITFESGGARSTTFHSSSCYCTRHVATFVCALQALPFSRSRQVFGSGLFSSSPPPHGEGGPAQRDHPL